ERDAFVRGCLRRELPRRRQGRAGADTQNTGPCEGWPVVPIAPCRPGTQIQPTLHCVHLKLSVCRVLCRRPLPVIAAHWLDCSQCSGVGGPDTITRMDTRQYRTSFPTMRGGARRSSGTEESVASPPAVRRRNAAIAGGRGSPGCTVRQLA